MEIWSDLNDRLVKDSEGNIKKDINVESVKTSIRNILGTNQGERVFLPQFGGRLGSLLFEPINSHLADRLSQEVKNIIEIWDGRVTVESVDVKSDADNSYVEISVNFIIRGYVESFTATTTITT